MAYTEKVTFEINLDKINTSAIRNASNGKWLKMTLVPTPDNEFNQYLVSQYVKGEQGVILGNGNDLTTVLEKIKGQQSAPVPQAMAWEDSAKKDVKPQEDQPLPF